jgi:hypothetical protein
VITREFFFPWRLTLLIDEFLSFFFAVRSRGFFDEGWRRKESKVCKANGHVLVLDHEGGKNLPLWKKEWDKKEQEWVSRFIEQNRFYFASVEIYFQKKKEEEGKNIIPEKSIASFFFPFLILTPYQNESHKKCRLRRCFR